MTIPRNRFGSAVLVASLAFPSACRQDNAPAEAAFAGAKKREPARVMVEPVVQREMVRRLETTTRVESQSQVQVFARASGVLVELVVEEGDIVELGQLLARLDDRDARLRLDDASAQLVDAQANLPKLQLAIQESQARLEASMRSAEQASRDHERNEALAKSTDRSVALISNKDLEASALAKSTAWATVEQNKLALERARVEATNGETAIQRSKVAVERAALELSYTRITAHVAGVIAERSIKVGDTISSSTLAFTITDPNNLRAVFFRPQRELGMFQGALHAGSAEALAHTAELEIVAWAEALPKRRFKGVIERIAPTIDAASGNFRVTARMDPQAEGDPGARLLPGMLIRIEIVTERHPRALVVPKRAIRREGDRSSIVVVRDNKAHSVIVSEGFTDDTSVEILPAESAELAPGVPVVVVGNRDLEEGAEVLVTESAERGAGV